MAVSKRQVKGAVERILSSPELEHESRLARLLTFVVEQSFEGLPDELNEKLVGVEVFGRPADYDPKDDSVARVEARRLRARLEAYYKGSGSTDAVRIELPKASFNPEFSVVDVVRERRKMEIPWRPIAIVSAFLGLVAGGIYFVKLPRGAAVASSGHRLLTNQKGNSRTPAFSTDGEKIVYSKDFEGHTSTLFVQELSGGVTRALTFGEVKDTDPVWSPDGEKVAFLRQKGRNRFALMIKVASNVTKPETEVGELSARGSMDWVADGSGLLVSDRGVIQKIAIGSSQREPFTSGEGDSEPRSSPDGKWIAFIRELNSGFYDLMLMGANGELPKRIVSRSAILMDSSLGHFIEKMFERRCSMSRENKH
ncbi:MAG: hypothetical protein FJW36_25745, partial [Acidobacteria bacterium]|nr:hypothetical protein [Acidobacteriota bacterium]